MTYRELFPTAPLDSVLECFWWAQQTTDLPQLILPDACEDILIRKDTSLNIQIEVVGLMTSSRKYSPILGSEILGLRFKAGMLNLFLQHDPFQCRDQVVPLKDLSRCFYEKLRHLLEPFRTYPLCQSIGSLNDLLVCQLESLVLKPSRLQSALKGGCSLSEVRLSERQLRRRSLRDVGVTPHLLTRLLRFRSASETLKYSSLPLCDIAFRHGYADQSHLTREFKFFAQCSPGQYVRFLQDPALYSQL